MTNKDSNKKSLFFCKYTKNILSFLTFKCYIIYFVLFKELFI